MQTKLEVNELLHYLSRKRSSLKSAVRKSRELPEEKLTKFVLGQAMIAHTEMSSLTELINETLFEFNLHSKKDLDKFVSGCPVVHDTEASDHEHLNDKSNDSDSDGESCLENSASHSESDSYYSSKDELE